MITPHRLRRVRRASPAWPTSGLRWQADVAGVENFPAGPACRPRPGILWAVAMTQKASESGSFVRYDESAAERHERIQREVEKARRSFRLTDGQRKTLRNARRAS
jgi:hypothetical protein